MEAAAAASVSTRMGRFRLLLRKSPPAGKTY
jgi:hypothetical protein